MFNTSRSLLCWQPQLLSQLTIDKSSIFISSFHSLTKSVSSVLFLVQTVLFTSPVTAILRRDLFCLCYSLLLSCTKLKRLILFCKSALLHLWALLFPDSFSFHFFMAFSSPEQMSFAAVSFQTVLSLTPEPHLSLPFLDLSIWISPRYFKPNLWTKPRILPYPTL